MSGNNRMWKYMGISLALYTVGLLSYSAYDKSQRDPEESRRKLAKLERDKQAWANAQDELKNHCQKLSNVSLDCQNKLLSKAPNANGSSCDEAIEAFSNCNELKSALQTPRGWQENRAKIKRVGAIAAIDE